MYSPGDDGGRNPTQLDPLSIDPPQIMIIHQHEIREFPFLSYLLGTQVVWGRYNSTRWMEEEVVTYVYHTTCVDLESLSGTEQTIPTKVTSSIARCIFSACLFNRFPHYLLNNRSKKISLGCVAKNQHFSENPSKYLDLLIWCLEQVLQIFSKMVFFVA